MIPIESNRGNYRDLPGDSDRRLVPVVFGCYLSTNFDPCSVAGAVILKLEAAF
jgi:hypothetical protein